MPPLKVLVIGAGIGGLGAAIALRQQGHEVEIFEKSELTNEVGAADHLAPNCTTVLNRVGLYPGNFGGTLLRHITWKVAAGTESLLSLPLVEEDRNSFQAEWHLIHRIDLHSELKRRATAQDGEGIPVKLHTDCPVAGVDCETATITLIGGDTATGDFIVVADGIHSRIRNRIAGDHKPVPSGKSCYRCNVSKSVLKEDPATAAFAETPGEMMEVSAHDRRLVIYPCANDTVLNITAFVPSEEAHAEEEGWDHSANKAQMLASFSNFAPDVQALLQKAPEDDVKVWDLLDMETLPTWTNGRAALLGDAAHACLPYIGQGSAMAIEDAAALAAVIPLDTPTEDIPQRLRLYEQCRKKRTDAVQAFARKRGRDVADKNGRVPSGKATLEFIQYCADHDAWNHSKDILMKELGQAA